VVLAEGYTDVIAMHQAGLRNTVGLMGTALTEEQVAELGRLASVVVLALDADSAGQEAMLRAARVAAGRRLELRVVELPAGSDPADLVLARGAGEMRALVEASVPFVRFRVERELDRGDLATAEGKDRVIEALRPVFADERTLPPSAMREELVALVADRLNLAPALVASWLARGAGGGRPSAAGAGGHPRAKGSSVLASDDAPGEVAVRRARPALDAAGRAERAFLAVCLALPAAGRERLAELDLDEDFTSDLTRRAAAWVRDRDDDAAPPRDDAELTALLAELAVTAAGSPPSPAALEADAIQLDLLRLDRRIAAARAQAAGTVAPLVARREELRRRYDAALDRAMAESQPAAP
jgi:DNA primase